MFIFIRLSFREDNLITLAKKSLLAHQELKQSGWLGSKPLSPPPPLASLLPYLPSLLPFWLSSQQHTGLIVMEPPLGLGCLALGTWDGPAHIPTSTQALCGPFPSPESLRVCGPSPGENVSPKMPGLCISASNSHAFPSRETKCSSPRVVASKKFP